MFGIGAQELAIILVVALLVFGPKRLPELARTLGRGLAEFRRASSDLRHSVQLDLDDERHIDGDRQNPHSAMPHTEHTSEPAPVAESVSDAPSTSAATADVGASAEAQPEADTEAPTRAKDAAGE
jgi:TatA/E family protein of Tat protein translocase